MTSNSNIPTFTVIPVSDVNGAVTNYKVSVTSGIKLLTGDSISFTLPTEVGFSSSSTFSCSAISNLASVSCSKINSNTGV